MNGVSGEKILAPLRGVTIRAFRAVYADVLRESGFTEAITPFITAIQGFNPLRDRELKACEPVAADGFRLTPQFIGKDAAALGVCLRRVREAGFETADLNCGCPYPMVRNKGRGSGLLKTPDVLRRLLDVGCEVMGAGCFSVKTRLGVEHPDELLALMPIFNQYPLRFLTVHARVARQMYEGACDDAAFEAVRKTSANPIVPNGDIALNAPERPVMIGRAFVRSLGERADCDALLKSYIAVSQAELFGDRPVLGRIKELVAYWKDQRIWSRRWNLLKTARTISELTSLL